MTAKIYCFASAKGGTGKTVLSASFATFLGALGKKVLLIDTDAATNGLTLLCLEKLVDSKRAFKIESRKLFGIFESKGNYEATPINIYKNVELIPATYVMEQTDLPITSDFEISLRHALNAFGNNYDYIFLDAQAGSDAYAQIAMSYSNQVVIVSEYDPVSIAGMERLFSVFKNVLPYEKKWVLYNKVLPEFAKDIGKKRIVEKILPPIPWDEEVVRAFAERKLALDLEKGSEHTIAIMRTVGSLFGDQIKEEIENWKTEKSESIREPIKIQKRKIDSEIVAFQRAFLENQYKLQRLKRKYRTNLLFGFTILIISVFYAYLFGSQVFPSESSQVLVITTTIGGFGTILLLYLSRVSEQKNKVKEIEVASQVIALKTKLDELNETSKRKGALLDSDLEHLLEQ